MDDLIKPSSAFQEQAHIKSIDEYHQLWREANENPEIYWDLLAQKKISWFKKYDKVLNTEKAPYYSWFEGGKLNIADQCIDRHIEKHGNKSAILWESETKDKRNITYNELLSSVNRFANLLKQDFEIKKGDRVAIYMPMIPEAIFAMLACARIGAIHVVIFGGFSADVLRERIIDTKAKLIITADGSYRRGKPYSLKSIVDKAIEDASSKISAKILLIRHNNQEVSFKDSRDYEYDTLIKTKSTEIKSNLMESEDTSFILHTSGSTGKPKGIVHTIAGYILWAQHTTEIVFDIKEKDVFWCTADIGWITGHTYGVYGPLAIGATIFMYDGTPTFPSAARWWEIIEKYRITQFYTAPTAIRLLRRDGPDEPLEHDLSSLKVLGTVGEPIDPDTWRWYFETVGGSRCPIVDTWWQTETGGHIVAPLPGATPLKPGSATMPLPGIKTEILNSKGESVEQGETGFLCITKPWPSMFRSIWMDDNRYLDNYYNVIKDASNKKHIYFSGDGAYYDKNNYIIITGRTDDTMNVSGHRIDSAEIESVITNDSAVSEAAVISRPDPISGENIVAFIVLNDSFKHITDAELLDRINLDIRKKFSPAVRIDKLVIVSALPKTRSGKILRRVLRSIAREEKIPHDLSSLDNPKSIDEIQEKYWN